MLSLDNDKKSILRAW